MESCRALGLNRAETTVSRESDSPGDRDDRARIPQTALLMDAPRVPSIIGVPQIDLFSGCKSDEIVALPATSAPVNAKVPPARSRGSARPDNAWQRARVC
jgi:hypothetical protein